MFKLSSVSAPQVLEGQDGLCKCADCTGNKVVSIFILHATSCSDVTGCIIAVEDVMDQDSLSLQDSALEDLPPR